MNKIIWTILIVILFGGFTFGVYNYFKLKNNKIVLFPQISTEFVPVAKMGEYYETEILGTLIGAKSKIDITAEFLPDGLELKDCVTIFNTTSLPKPNSVVKCILKGYPATRGIYDIALMSSAKGFSKQLTYEVVLNIE